jgi:hypothetical protein
VWCKGAKVQLWLCLTARRIVAIEISRMVQFLVPTGVETGWWIEEGGSALNGRVLWLMELLGFLSMSDRGGMSPIYFTKNGESIRCLLLALENRSLRYFVGYASHN